METVLKVIRIEMRVDIIKMDEVAEREDDQ